MVAGSNRTVTATFPMQRKAISTTAKTPAGMTLAKHLREPAPISPKRATSRTMTTTAAPASAIGPPTLKLTTIRTAQAGTAKATPRMAPASSSEGTLPLGCRKPHTAPSTAAESARNAAINKWTALATPASNPPLDSAQATKAAAIPQARAIPSAQASQNHHDVKDSRVFRHASPAVTEKFPEASGSPVPGFRSVTLDG
ncbi:hypothetical protein D3C73_1063480 [compost metagenome]